jgi:hypothetical protein
MLLHMHVTRPPVNFQLHCQRRIEVNICFHLLLLIAILSSYASHSLCILTSHAPNTPCGAVLHLKSKGTESMQPNSSLTLQSRILIQAEVLSGWHNSEGVGVTHSPSPALHTDDGVTLAKNTELDGIHDTPFQTTVNILLPGGILEVWLLFREVEGVYAAVQVGVLFMSVVRTWRAKRRETYSGRHGIAGNHDDGTDGTVLGHQTSGCATEAS